VITQIRQVVAAALWYAFLLAGAGCAIFIPIHNAIAGPNP
jgi:hypothetical protein